MEDLVMMLFSSDHVKHKAITVYVYLLEEISNSTDSLHAKRDIETALEHN